MQRTTTINEPVPTYGSAARPLVESSHSAVSWGAVVAGAVIAAALSFTLITGGTGLGFLAVSPWKNDGASGDTLAIGTIAWLFVTQIIAFGVAGYVTGRLRTKWTDVRGDEIFFRDTAHGFIVWALSSVVGVVVITMTAAGIVSGAAKTGATLAGAGAGAAGATASAVVQNDDQFSLDYFTDSLLRPTDPSGPYMGGDSKELSTIMARSLANGEVSENDRRYMIGVIAQRTGMSEAEAERRLDEVTQQAVQAKEELEVKAREAADEARKAAAIFALWAFASLFVGAFVASLAATIGGRARDRF